MSKRTTCSCGCSTQKKVLTVTQIDNKTVLEPENLENRDKILVLSKNVNNAYGVKVMSTLTVKDLVRDIEDPNVAFLLVEMKEPAAPVEPEEPGESGTEPTDPATPEEPGEGGTDDEV